jgi:hypothetical protein
MKIVYWISILIITVALMNVLFINGKSRRILKTGINKATNCIAGLHKIISIRAMEVAFWIMTIGIVSVWLTLATLCIKATHKFANLHGHAIKYAILISSCVAFIAMLFFIDQLQDETNPAIQSNNEILKQAAERNGTTKKDTVT